jgi:hypothetical protein
MDNNLIKVKIPKISNNNKPKCIFETTNIPTINNNETVLKPYNQLIMDNYSQIPENCPIDFGYSQIIKIIVFEIVHEDALPIHPKVLCETIMRQSGNNPVFPRIKKNNTTQEAKVHFLDEQGGSILGFVKYKLRYGFFDTIDNINEKAVLLFYRTDKKIAIAAQILLKQLCDKTETIDDILVNVTDKIGLNEPVHPDHLDRDASKVEIEEKIFLRVKIAGDLSNEEIDKLRSEKNLPPNEFTGNRPAPLSELNNMGKTRHFDPSKILSGGSKKNKKTRKLKYRQ